MTFQGTNKNINLVAVISSLLVDSPFKDWFGEFSNETIFRRGKAWQDNKTEIRSFLVFHAGSVSYQLNAVPLCHSPVSTLNSPHESPTLRQLLDTSRDIYGRSNVGLEPHKLQEHVIMYHCLSSRCDTNFK